MLGHRRPPDANSGNYMSNTQFADYLADLRVNRTARLNGIRKISPHRPEIDAHTSQSEPEPEPNPHASADDEPLVPAPLRIRPSKDRIAAQHTRDISTPLIGPVGYVEDELRHKEKDEAQIIRMALEELDLEEEQKIYRAAQDKAISLVLSHEKKSRYDDTVPQSTDTYPQKPAHLARTTEADLPSQNATRESAEAIALPQIPVSDNTPQMQPKKKKSYSSLASAVANDVAIMKRRVSSGGRRLVSGGRRKASTEQTPFENPTDKIFEEPESIPEEGVSTTSRSSPLSGPVLSLTMPAQEETVPDIPKHIRKNPFARVRFNKDNFERSNSVVSTVTNRFNPVEIQRNPPSQSRKPWYMSNWTEQTASNTAPLPEASVSQQNDEPRKSKDGVEIRSDEIRSATSMKRSERSEKLPQPTAVSNRNDRPIVSFQKDWTPPEITSKADPPTPERPQSRSAALQRPTGARSLFGSRRQMPGRPQTPQSTIIDIPAPKSDARPSHRMRCGIPQHSAPGNIPNSIPILILPDDDGSAPSKVLSEEPEMDRADPLACKSPPRKTTTQSEPRPASTPVAPPRKVAPIQQPIPDIYTPDSLPKRPLPTPVSTNPRQSTHNRPPAPTAQRRPAAPSVASSRNVALCAQCALPISGRVLAAAGQRFHPECFACHACSIHLECVAFYPEPEQRYHERLARIQQRQNGQPVSFPPHPHGPSADEQEMQLRQEELDGDEGLRFFCHLDFHELFSPRCKSCKTPIEGEVVVACGSEWHVGHFFCAQCGDPFDQSTPFVEKDGYAWCVGCHTNRYSPKCRGCRKPVTQVVVNALGFDWHAECFCCVECGGGFDDGRYFLREASEQPVCSGCEERRLKA